MADFIGNRDVPTNGWTDVTGGLIAGSLITLQNVTNRHLWFHLGPTPPARKNDGALLVRLGDIASLTIATKLWVLTEGDQVHVSERD